MLGALAHCNVPVKNQEKFETLMSDFIRYARRQNGCIYYDFGKVAGKETEYVIIQKWATQADFDAYLEDPTFGSRAMKLITLSENFLGMDIFDIIY